MIEERITVPHARACGKSTDLVTKTYPVPEERMKKNLLEEIAEIVETWTIPEFQTGVTGEYREGCNTAVKGVVAWLRSGKGGFSSKTMKEHQRMRKISQDILAANYSTDAKVLAEWTLRQLRIP